MDAIKATNDFVDIHYQQSGKSTNTNAMGMREMQALAHSMPGWSNTTLEQC